MTQDLVAVAPSSRVPVVCPHDRALLEPRGAEHEYCGRCERLYSVERGVLRFMQEDDAFYEGTYHNHVRYAPRGEAPWQIWPLWLINSGYPWSVREHLPAGSLVVELGCAGGVRYFGQRYRMVGCDVSRSSLQSLSSIYTTLLQVDATKCIPLADDSADGIVSSYFWEHVAPERKPVLASECARVLRPGGKLIFLYDVETDNPLIGHYARRSPELYRERFLAADGHVGYQSIDDNRRIFSAAGLRVIEHRGLEKTPLQPASVYTKLAAFGGRAQRAFTWGEALGRRPLFYPHTALLRTLDTLLAPWLPQRWARIALTVCEKRP
jgi:SAM-dependent methyltransferase